MTYHQKDKGVIGLDLQRSVCSAYMINWGGELQNLFKEITQNTEGSSAVYDEKNKKIVITKEQLEIDELTEDDRRTLDLKTKIGNSLDTDIVLSGDVPSDHGNKMPFLDLSIWLEESEDCDIFKSFLIQTSSCAVHQEPSIFVK